MAGSLKDQLLKAGLVDKKKVRQVELEQRKKQKQSRQQGKAPVTEAQDHAAALEAARREKLAKDRLLETQRKEALAARARQAEIRQIIAQHQIKPPRDADVRYQFVDQGKVRFVWVTADLQRQLSAGTLGLVTLDGGVVLLPSAQVERIYQRDPALVIAPPAAAAGPDSAPDDPYTDYPIPDDLHW